MLMWPSFDLLTISSVNPVLNQFISLINNVCAISNQCYARIIINFIIQYCNFQDFIANCINILINPIHVHMNIENWICRPIISMKILLDHIDVLLQIIFQVMKIFQKRVSLVPGCPEILKLIATSMIALILLFTLSKPIYHSHYITGHD